MTIRCQAETHRGADGPCGGPDDPSKTLVMTTIPVSTAVTTAEIDRGDAANGTNLRKWGWFALTTAAYLMFMASFATWYISVPAFAAIILTGWQVNEAHKELIAIQSQQFLKRRS